MDLDPQPTVSESGRDGEEWNVQDKVMKNAMRGHIVALGEYAKHPDTADYLRAEVRQDVALLKEQMELHALIKPSPPPPPPPQTKLRSHDDLIANLDRAVLKVTRFMSDLRRQPEKFWAHLMNVCKVYKFGARELPQLFLLLFTETEDMAWTKTLLEKKCQTVKQIEDLFMSKYQTASWKLDRLYKLLSTKRSSGESIDSVCSRFLASLGECGIDPCNEVAPADLDFKDVIRAVCHSLFPPAIQNNMLARQKQGVEMTTAEMIQQARAFKGPAVAEHTMTTPNATNKQEPSRKRPYQQASTSGHLCTYHGQNSTHNSSQCKVLLAKAGTLGPQAGPRPAMTAPLKRCFKCREPLTPGHSCRGEGPAARVVTVIRDGDSITATESGEFSANIADDLCVLSIEDTQAHPSLCVTGGGAQGLYVPVQINGNNANALLDSGASTSFVSPAFAERTGLTIIPAIGVVELASPSANVARVGITAPTTVQLNGTEATISFEVMDLGPIDVILGIDSCTPLNWEVRLGSKVGTNGSLDPSNEETLSYPYSRQSDSPTPSSPSSEPIKVVSDDEEALINELGETINANISIRMGTFCQLPEAVIHLDTGDHPGFCKRQYPVANHMKHHVDKQVSEWLEYGIIKPSTTLTQWNSPLIAVCKKDEQGMPTKVRVVLDPRHINEVIKSVNYPLPLIQDLLESLAGATFFTTLDLKMSFNQFPVHEPDQGVTAFTWGGTQYVFVGCPFGLKPISAIVQRTMCRLFNKCTTFVAVFVDDIIVFSKTMSDHTQHVKQAIQLLNEANLKMNADKCHYAQRSVEILGHIISAAGIKVSLNKLKDDKHFQLPVTSKHIESDLGFFNFFRNFIPNYAALTAPLERIRKSHDLTAVWNEEHAQVYKTLKAVLFSDITLAFPDFSQPFLVATDASNHGVGAVLYQEINSQVRYVNFASAALTSGQKNYSATKKELYAIVFALNKFRNYIWGAHFTLYTDHRALTYLFTVNHTSPMVNTWMEIVLDFNFEIIHKPGILNVLPDYLSRMYISRSEDGNSGDRPIALATRVSARVDDDSSAWKLNEKIFIKLDQLWGKHTVDAFASASNHQLPQYYSFENTALDHDWSGANLYINPPLGLMSKIIDKLIHDQATATIITPKLEKKTWFRKLRALAIQAPITLPQSVRHHGRDHELLAWRVSGKYLHNVTGNFNCGKLPIKNLSEIDFSTAQLMMIRGATKGDPGAVVESQSMIPRLGLISGATGLSDPGVPERASLIQRAHLSGHFGATAMYKSLFLSGTSWPGMIDDCRRECLKCTQCQRFSIGKHGYHPIKSIHADLPFDHIAVDLAGPFAPSSGEKHVYLMVMVDVATRFVFLRTLPNKETATIAAALFKVCCDVGFPMIIQSDNGKEFVSALVQTWTTAAGIDHRLISPYHPRANGLAERNVQTAKATIYKHLKGKEGDWAMYVPQVQFFINTKIANIHNSTPYSLMFGRSHNLFRDYSRAEDHTPTEEELLERLEILTQVVYPTINEKSRATALNSNNLKNKDGHQPTSIPIGAYVMAKDALKSAKAQPTYLGPYKVIRRNRGGAYELEDALGHRFKRAPETLKLVLRSTDQAHVTTLNAVNILQHEGERGTPSCRYQVEWYNGEQESSWMPSHQFEDQRLITAYWQRVDAQHERDNPPIARIRIPQSFSLG
jgi:transposase InsO family protein